MAAGEVWTFDEERRLTRLIKSINRETAKWKRISKYWMYGALFGIGYIIVDLIRWMV